MQINGPSNIHGAQGVNAPKAAAETEQSAQSSPTAASPTAASPTAASPTAANPAAGADEVSISQEADLLSRIDDIPDIRQDRVDQIRADIANGTYETDEKIDVAVSQLLDEIA